MPLTSGNLNDSFTFNETGTPPILEAVVIKDLMCVIATFGCVLCAKASFTEFGPPSVPACANLPSLRALGAVSVQTLVMRACINTYT